MYNPKPIDTSDVKLSNEISELIEDLSKNIHEVWAYQKVKDGWVYAPETDEEKKTHRCITQYENLSEKDKQYDRNTVTQTIKTLLYMGYKITKE